ncbi:hypothetical protein [Sinorhizobium mexicanum]|uniref:hypothetical protein n=1 Tax=Sinorhizobium mexicanum TaxID=375549 RepID=UPI003CC91081
MTSIEQVRTTSTIFADIGDLAAVERLKPVDSTTNPTIVLKAIESETFGLNS